MFNVYQRTELLVGAEAMERIRQQHVIIFGVGGVGSWCAECLVRSGIGHLTMVDFDRVCDSNINRQLMATTQTIGQLKVEVLRERLLTINPQADITALTTPFNEQTAEGFHLADYDFIIDAIDSLNDKALLIEMACQTKAHFFSSMGAALKADPTRIQVAEFWKVKGDPLARALRNRFKKLKRFPRRKFKCVFSDELLRNLGEEKESHDVSASRKRVNGTLAHITAMFGMMLAGLVMQEAGKL